MGGDVGPPLVDLMHLRLDLGVLIEGIIRESEIYSGKAFSSSE